MTLKDIAKEAGVSVSTVSRVINNKGSNAASKETRDKIWSIIRKTGYTPNPMAQNLKKGEGSFVPEARTRFIDCLHARSTDISNDSFFFELERSIEQMAFNQNYIVKHSYSILDIHNQAILTQLKDEHVDGIIILGRCNFTKDQLRFLYNSYKNIVYVGLNPLNMKCDQITCNGYEASVAAIKHLYDLGHKKIAYIGEQKDECRFQGYKDALSSYQLPFDIKITCDTIQSTNGGYIGASKLIDKGGDFTAVFCANDLTAIGAIKAFNEHKISIPKNISIISVDDIDFAQYSSPMLTTIHIPIDELGKMATKILIDRINGGHRLPIKMELPFTISKRDSCCRLRR